LERAGAIEERGLGSAEGDDDLVAVAARDEALDVALEVGAGDGGGIPNQPSTEGRLPEDAILVDERLDFRLDEKFGLLGKLRRVGEREHLARQRQVECRRHVASSLNYAAGG